MIRCLHCSMQFSETPRTGTILGQTEEQRLAALVEKLGMHLQMAHQGELLTIQMLSATMAGVAILCQFDGLSAGLQGQRAKSAASLSAVIRRVLTDEDIEGIVRKRELYHSEVARLLREMRDWLAYSDILAPSAPLEPSNVGAMK